MKNFILGLQWMLFIIAASVAVPISVSDLFMLNQQETLLLIQNTLFILGTAGFLQGYFGHKMPIAENPAGLWWSVLSIYSSIATAGFVTNKEVLGIFSGGMIFSGILFIVFFYTGLLKKISFLFSPLITFIYLILVSLQLSGTFIKGIIGINGHNQKIDTVTTILGISIIIVTFCLGSSKIKKIRQFSILLSIGIGWLLFILFKKTDNIIFENTIISFPKFLALGVPKFNFGMLSTSFFITFLLIMNMLASINIMGNITGKNSEETAEKYEKAGLISGINQILGGLFNTVGTVPVSSSAGFVIQIGEKSMIPYLLGCVFVSLVSLFPSFVNILAALPVSISYSVSFVIFAKLISIALFELKNVIDEEHSYVIIGVSLLAGVGINFLPYSALSSLPSIISAFIGNGLIMGSLLGIILEQIFLFKNKKFKK